MTVEDERDRLKRMVQIVAVTSPDYNALRMAQLSARDLLTEMYGAVEFPKIGG